MDSFSFAEELLNDSPDLVIASLDIAWLLQIFLCKKLSIFMWISYLKIKPV